MSRETLVVCRDETYLPSGESDISGRESVVSISELLDRISEDEAQDVFERLTNLDVERQHDTPLYALVSTQLWNSGQYHDESPHFDQLFPLYRHLSEHVTAETDRIVTRGVSGRNLDVVRDLADNEGIELETEAVEAESTSGRRQLLEQLPWLLVSVIDTFLSLVLRLVYSGSESDVLIKYPMFRPGTFSPIEDRLTVPFDATCTLLTLNCLSKSDVVNDETNLVPFRCFASVGDHLRGYRAVVGTLVDVTVTRETEDAVVDAVESEIGVRMEQTVSRIFFRGVVNNLDAVLYYPTADRLFERGSYDAVLVTSGGPSGQTLHVPAADHGARTAQMGHSIVTPPQPTRVRYWDSYFVEGSIVDDFASETGETEFVSTGLPKHVDIYERFTRHGGGHENDDDSETEQRLLVGTQPFSDDYRRQLLREVVLPVVEQTDWDVVVKLHPGESREFYQRVLSELGYPLDETVGLSVATDDLYGWIRDSDLLLTVTSNVGIEAVVLGTPAAVYNVWSPLVRSPLYAKYGSVPLLQSTADLLELVSDDFDAANEWERQRQLIEGPYKIVGNSLDKIADTIEDEIRGDS